MAQHEIDLEHLLKLRLVVARYGEMDSARWWNTQGMLGRYGAIAMRRGFPKTHHFAQARVVFAVASSRCEEVFSSPGCVTLWALPAELEDRFDAQWQGWLDQAADWAPVFGKLEANGGKDLLGMMQELELVTQGQVEAVGKLRRSAEGRAVAIAGMGELSDEALTLLAAAFSRGESGQPAIPYVKLGA